MIRIFLLFSLIAFVACQTAPTRVYEKSQIDFELMRKRAKEPIRITEETVIIDARKTFDYTVAHIPGSVNINWTDFADRSGNFEGQLKNDLEREARRLAGYGIGIDTPVIVIGDGIHGQGEEGRLAWTLLYLGVKDVQVADTDALNLRYSNQTPPPRESAKFWRPQLRESIRADRKEVMSAVAKKDKPGSIYILDVRTKDEYFSKSRNLQYEIPDLGAVNIPWTEFFTGEGRPKLSIRKELQAINIGLNDRIVVLSNRGVRSAAVTVALLSVGFKKVSNFPGGYQELLSKSPRSM